VGPAGAQRIAQTFCLGCLARRASIELATSEIIPRGAATAPRNSKRRSWRALRHGGRWPDSPIGLDKLTTGCFSFAVDMLRNTHWTPELCLRKSPGVWGRSLQFQQHFASAFLKARSALCRA
jgi:hypothetical protein